MQYIRLPLLAAFFVTFAMPAPAMTLKQFCAAQNQECADPGCKAAPSRHGYDYCVKKICGARYVACLQSGCYEWKNKPNVCFSGRK